VRAHDQEKPWFIYYSTGCSHAPHQVAVEWSEKYRGKFDQGWDVLREETFERQKALGVIPPDAELTPRPDVLPAWDSLSSSEQTLYARQMEVYAGFQENADENIGRLLDAVDEMGELDNTLVIYIFGDNGASLEGTLTGSFNELTMQNGIALTPEQQLSLIGQYGGLDAWGTDAYAPHYAAAWAWAGNAPFQWGKQVASHLGGTRNATVVSWPERIKDAGALRTQFTHVIDVGPTILEAAGIPEPTVVDGIGQKPMEGTSFLYTFEDANAPERHTVQYFEAVGNRAIYKDGWWAACKLDRIPWDLSPATMARFAPGTYDPKQDTWELYYLPDDFSQANDLAAENPEKLAELEELFWEEAEKHNVLPLLAAFSVFFGDLPPMPTITTQTFYGDVQNIASGMIPRIYGRSYAIEAELSIPAEGAEGVIVAEADEMGGFSLWVDENGLLHHSYSMMGVERYEHVSNEPIPTGKVLVRMLFDADRQERSAGGTVSLYANDEKIGEGRIEKTVGVRFSAYAGLDIGRDNGLPVDRAYADKSPYAFTGTVKKVVFDLKPASHEDEKALHEGGAHVATAHGISA
jgi:arylsulfatase